MPRLKPGHRLSERSRTTDVLTDEQVDFKSLLLSKQVLNGLNDAGFEKPSPIQLKAIPLGRCGLDLIAQAKSGTGKTCVFSVIALESVVLQCPGIQVLVLAPTREIAVQIKDVVTAIGCHMTGLICGVFIGGVHVEEDKKVLKKCHIAVGTPGRVKFLIENHFLKTDAIRLFILDEADKLLDESFQEQINWIFSSLPINKQVIALSATYPEHLAQHLMRYMREPTFVRLNADNPTLQGLKQFYLVVPSHPLPHKTFQEKVDRLLKLLSELNFHQCLIFSNYQIRAQSLCETLCSKGWPADYIAGSQTQSRRLQAMEKLKSFKCRILISTDLVTFSSAQLQQYMTKVLYKTARGIDAERVNLVVNMDLPRDSETYLHRIGRAGRFGTRGVAVTYIAQGKEENEFSKMKEGIGANIDCLPEHIPESFYEHKSQEYDVESSAATQSAVVELSILKHDKHNGDEKGISTSVTDTDYSKHKSKERKESLETEEKIKDSASFDCHKEKQAKHVNKNVRENGDSVKFKDVRLDISKTIEPLTECPENERENSDTLQLCPESTNNQTKEVQSLENADTEPSSRSEVSSKFNISNNFNQKTTLSGSHVGKETKWSSHKEEFNHKSNQKKVTITKQEVSAPHYEKRFFTDVESVASNVGLNMKGSKVQRDAKTFDKVCPILDKQDSSGSQDSSISDYDASDSSDSIGNQLQTPNYEHKYDACEKNVYNRKQHPVKSSLDANSTAQEKEVVLDLNYDNQKRPQSYSEQNLDESNFAFQSLFQSFPDEDSLPSPAEFDKVFERYLQTPLSKDDDDDYKDASDCGLTFPGTKNNEMNGRHLRAANDVSKSEIRKPVVLATYSKTGTEAKVDDHNNRHLLRNFSSREQRMCTKLEGVSNMLQQPVSCEKQRQKRQVSQVTSLENTQQKESADTEHHKSMSNPAGWMAGKEGSGIMKESNLFRKTCASGKHSQFQPTYTRQPYGNGYQSTYDEQKLMPNDFHYQGSTLPETPCECKSLDTPLHFGDRYATDSCVNVWHSDCYSRSQEYGNSGRYPPCNVTHYNQTDQHPWTRAWENAYKRQTNCIASFVYSSRNYSFV